MNEHENVLTEEEVRVIAGDEYAAYHADPVELHHRLVGTLGRWEAARVWRWLTVMRQQENRLWHEDPTAA